MKEISGIENIEEFDSTVPVYLSYDVKQKLIKTGPPHGKKVGFLVGDVFWEEGLEYIVVTDLIQDIDEMVEKVDDTRLVVGSFFHGDSLEEHIDDLPYGLSEKSYFTVLRASAPEEEKGYEMEFEAYKVEDNSPREVSHKFTYLVEEEEIDDPIYIQREMSLFRQSEKMLSFLFLGVFASLFGIFGGIAGFLLSKDFSQKKRLFLLGIGVVSTFFWLGLTSLI